VKITETYLEGCFVIEPTIFEDERGSFFEAFKKDSLEKAIGEPINFVQDNHSISKQWVLRGLHFQRGASAQSKLVHVAYGEVLDVVVDVRRESPTFGNHFKIRLSAKNHKMLFIPKGFAHGFLVLEEQTVFQYNCDAYYHKASETGILYNDLDLQIDWEFPSEQFILSKKDQQLPSFKNLLE
tara:strand:- start:59371 stop:59916 length:546 start_codon:yes stop_codon:yes gene_type:complete